MITAILIILLVITVILLVAAITATVYIYGYMLLILTAMALHFVGELGRWAYHRYFVPSPSHYQSLRDELRSRC